MIYSCSYFCYSLWVVGNRHFIPLKIGATLSQVCLFSSGQCGSCWANAAAEQLASDSLRVNKWNPGVLSRQQLVDCTYSNYDGCNGGDETDAWDYVKRKGGIALESNYPYWASGRTCADSAASGSFALTVSSWGAFYDEVSMARYVSSTGPLAVDFCASKLSFYTGGIITSGSVGDCTSINHQVQLVGINFDNPALPYWIVSKTSSIFLIYPYSWMTLYLQFRFETLGAQTGAMVVTSTSNTGKTYVRLGHSRRTRTQHTRPQCSPQYLQNQLSLPLPTNHRQR